MKGEPMTIDKAVHLGDGAYVHHDGFHVVLTANHHDPVHATDKVHLEPRALEMFLDWITANYNIEIKKINEPEIEPENHEAKRPRMA
jgi:hypothetical protein